MESVTVYSPKGEPMEVSRPNANDLVKFHGFGYAPVAEETSKKEPKAVTPKEEPKVEAPVVEEEEEEETAKRGRPRKNAE